MEDKHGNKNNDLKTYAFSQRLSKSCDKDTLYVSSLQFKVRVCGSDECGAGSVTFF